MSTCVNININSKEWKALTAEIGQFEAVRDFMEYDRIRTVNEVRSDKPQLFKSAPSTQRLFGMKGKRQIQFHTNTVNAVYQFLTNIGVEVKSLPELLQVDGSAVDGAIAAANFVNKTVEIAEKERLEIMTNSKLSEEQRVKKLTEFWKKVNNKIPEEAAHWWYRLLKNDSSLKNLLWSHHKTALKSNELYQTKYGQLSGINSPEDLKEEAIGQLIAEAIKRVETKYKAPESYDLLRKLLVLINKLIAAFRVFRQDPFEVAAMKILSSDQSDLLSVDEYQELSKYTNLQVHNGVTYTSEDLDKLLLTNLKNKDKNISTYFNNSGLSLEQFISNVNSKHPFRKRNVHLDIPSELGLSNFIEIGGKVFLKSGNNKAFKKFYQFLDYKNKIVINNQNFYFLTDKFTFGTEQTLYKKELNIQARKKAASQGRYILKSTKNPRLSERIIKQMFDYIDYIKNNLYLKEAYQLELSELQKELSETPAKARELLEKKHLEMTKKLTKEEPQLREDIINALLYNIPETQQDLYKSLFSKMPTIVLVNLTFTRSFPNLNSDPLLADQESTRLFEDKPFRAINKLFYEQKIIPGTNAFLPEGFEKEIERVNQKIINNTLKPTLTEEEKELLKNAGYKGTSFNVKTKGMAVALEIKSFAKRRSFVRELMTKKKAVQENLMDKFKIKFPETVNFLEDAETINKLYSSLSSTMYDLNTIYNLDILPAALQTVSLLPYSFEVNSIEQVPTSFIGIDKNGLQYFAHKNDQSDSWLIYDNDDPFTSLYEIESKNILDFYKRTSTGNEEITTKNIRNTAERFANIIYNLGRYSEDLTLFLKMLDNSPALNEAVPHLSSSPLSKFVEVVSAILTEEGIVYDLLKKGKEEFFSAEVLTRLSNFVTGYSSLDILKDKLDKINESISNNSNLRYSLNAPGLINEDLSGFSTINLSKQEKQYLALTDNEDILRAINEAISNKTDVNVINELVRKLNTPFLLLGTDFLPEGLSIASRTITRLEAPNLTRMPETFWFSHNLSSIRMPNIKLSDLPSELREYVTNYNLEVRLADYSKDFSTKFKTGVTPSASTELTKTQTILKTGSYKESFPLVANLYKNSQTFPFYKIGRPGTKFSVEFGAHSTNPFPVELYEAFRLNHGGYKLNINAPLGWFSGTYTDSSLYITEVQSDVLQRLFEIATQEQREEQSAKRLAEGKSELRYATNASNFNEILKNNPSIKSNIDNYYKGWLATFVGVGLNMMLRESPAITKIFIPTSETYKNDVSSQSPYQYYDKMAKLFPTAVLTEDGKYWEINREDVYTGIFENAKDYYDIIMKAAIRAGFKEQKDITPDLGSDQYIAKTIIEELYMIDSLKDYLNSKQGNDHIKEIENWIDNTFSDEKPFTDDTPGGELVDSEGNVIPSDEETETDENIRKSIEESKKMLEEQKRQERQKRQGKIDFEKAMDDLLDQLSQAIKDKNVNQQNYIKKLIDDLNASNDKLFGLDLSQEESSESSTDPMFYRELPIESTEEFFANYVPEMNEQEQKNARANEIVNKLVERLRNALGIEASVITSDEARAMLAAYGHGYNNEPGFFFDGKVYLVGDKVTTETVFHEFAHPLLKAIRATNPTLFTNLYKRLEQTAEGKAIIEGVRAAYPDKVFGSPEFMEEVLAHALGKKADNINRSVPESTGFTKFIKDLLYAIKQLFRSVFKGGKIRIENLDVNTTLDELANMLVNESFVINTDVIKESAPEFIRNLNNEFVKEVAQIEQKRLRLISKALFNMSKKQRRLLDYTNYRETRNILKDEMGRSDFSEIISALYTYQTEGTQAFSTPEEEEAFLNSHAIALLNSILRLETGAERVLKHFKTIVDKIEDDSITPEEKQKALLSAFYLNRVIKDWREFIEEAKTQLRAANVPSNHEIFGILNNVTEKLDRTKTLSDKIYTEGVGEMLTDQLTTLMDNINKHYETILNNYRSRGASPEIIKLYEDEFDAVKLTPEKIKQYLLGELGDAHALNVFLEGFAHAQDPIIMGFAGYVKDRFVAMSSKIHENYYNFINDIEDLVNKAGYTSAYSRMTMGKDMLYLDIVERDENGLPTKTVWKYLTPFKDYKGKYRQLKLEKDKLKKLVETENTDEAKQKYVLAIAALESFEKAYMNRKYTEAFYEKERFFQDEIGLEAMRRRDAILDIIRSIKSGIQDPDDIIKNTELTKRYWREYKQLSSLYNLDGTPKDPDSMEYKVAQRLQEYKNFVKKFYDVVPLSGVFENAYLNFIRNLKLQGLSPDEMSIKIEEWTKLNTVKKLSSEFYEERGEVLLRLRQLSANDPNQLRITEIFDEINRLLSMYKDDNGHPEGSSIPLSVAERIKALEDEFQDLKSDDYFDFKGTEKIVRENYISNFSDYQKYLAGDTSAWADKSDDEILDLVNFMAYAENALMSPIVNRLVSEFSATNGRDPSASELTDIQTKALSILNSAIEKRALLAKLMDLSKREMTEDYVDMINNFIDASPEAIEFLKEATNRPDEGFNIDTVKSIFLSTVLPKLKEINPSITFTDISGNSSTITFSEWFDNNHIVNVYQSDTGEEQIKYTPTRLWTYTAPKEDRYYETTKFNDPETGEEIEIIGVPSLEYTTRIVKDSYVDDNGNTILLKTPRISMLDCIRQGIGIENATIDMHGDWLPKYNVPNSPYVNSDFAQLRATSPDKYNLLMALLKKHLEIQEELPYDSRLDLEYERYRASQYEVVTSKSETEGGGNPISKYFRNLRQYFAKTADNYEHGLNMEEREMFVKSDLFDDEYAKVPITGLYFIDPNLVSMDMITSISRYMQSAVKQRTLIDMLPMARVLQKITVENPPYEVKESVINSFKKGRLANRIASSIATPFGAKGNNFRAAALNAFIEKEFEGKNVSGWGSDTVSNFANTLLSLSSKTFFSFNLPSALKNSMGARWQSLIQAAAGNNFNSKDYALGTLWANKVTSEITLQIHKFGKKSLNYQLVELMDPTQERLSSGIREGKGISKSVGKDAFEFKYATNVREWTQLNASLSVFGAMLNKTLVDYTAPNGTVTKIKYSDAWEVVNGKLQLKQGVDQTYAPGGKNYVKFVKNLHGVTNKINGAYDSFNQPLAARYLLYRMIMHLKKYFMELFMERFKFRYSAKHGMIVPRYDGYTDSIGMGYYVEFLRAAKRFFGVYKMNFHNMTDTERQASKKVMMEGGLLLLFNLVLLGLLFGWDDDDEEKYAKLRAKSDALPLPFVTDNPDRDFKLNGWFSNHLLNLTMQIEAENDSWIPVPGLGLNDYADIFQLNSVALSSTIGSYTNIINQLYQMADYAVTGDTDALYKRTAGPYDWQTEGKFKFWNHLGKILTFTGTSVEPIKSIENLQRRENL